MALDDIIAKIKQDAEAEIARIKKETDDTVHKIITACDDECEELQKETRQIGERESADIRNRLQIETRLSMRKELLQGRMDLVDNVFEQVRSEITSDPKRYLVFLADQIFETAVDGNEKVVLSAADHESFGDELVTMIAQINERLSNANRKGELVLTSDQGDFDAGFILRKGRANTIMTLDTIISNLRDKNESRVARILAGEEL